MVGHSFVYWLDDFLKKNPSKDCMNLHRSEMCFYGMRGGRVYNVVKTWRAQIEHDRPDMILLVIGDNDVDSMLDMEALAKLIVGKARLWHQLTGADVAVSALFPRYPPSQQVKWSYSETYNDCAMLVNFEMGRLLQGNATIKLWKHPFAFPNERFDVAGKGDRYLTQQSHFRPDGVHLDKSGYCVLHRAVRTLLKVPWDSITR